MKSLQEIFTIVVNHLRQQQCQAKDPVSHTCQYRYSNDDEAILKCAVGCLIDDRHYNSKIEGRSLPKSLSELEDTINTATYNDHRTKELVDLLKASDVDVYGYSVLPLLNRLQFIHDENEPATWENQLLVTARSFELTMPLHDSVKA